MTLAPGAVMDELSSVPLRLLGHAPLKIGPHDVWFVFVMRHAP